MKNIVVWVAAIGLAILSKLGFLPGNEVIVLLMNCLFIVAGFVLLIKGADVFETTDDKYITYDSTKPQYIYIPTD